MGQLRKQDARCPSLRNQRHPQPVSNYKSLANALQVFTLLPLSIHPTAYSLQYTSIAIVHEVPVLFAKNLLQQALCRNHGKLMKPDYNEGQH